MKDGTQGFKHFFIESEQTPVDRATGIAELNRLARGHYFFTLHRNHKLAAAFVGGHLMGADFATSRPSEAADIDKQISKLTDREDSLIVVAVPKRWERTLGRVNFHELFPKMLRNGSSARHVWGVYSLWNPRTEGIDGGHFYRSPNYHADDTLLTAWVKDHPQPSREKPAVPLHLQPRLFGQHLMQQNRHSFHGYSGPQVGPGEQGHEV